jgi:aryl-alcohol dehydrogenase-like predicted oxidoreductase
MKYGSIPGVPKPISRLVQGTATDFDPAKPDACFALLDMALAHGINAFDTAHCYGADRSKLVGQWMRERGVRDRIVILAKGAHPYGSPRVTPADIESDLADTLGWMQTDAVELFVLHRDDPEVPVGPIVEILNKLKDEGKIGAFGGSNWSVERVREANEYAEAHGLTPFAVSSPNFSLAEQVQPPWGGCLTISGPQNEDARAWYAQSGMTLMPWSSLAGGFWSDRFHRDNLDTFAKDDYFAQLAIQCYCYESNFQRLDRARELAGHKGVTVTQIALAYVLSQPLSIFPLISCANEEMFAANTAALEITLTPQELAWLDLRSDSI